LANPFPPGGRLAVVAACLIAVLSVPLSGQRLEDFTQSGGLVHDWSTRHVVYPQVGSLDAMRAASLDPRAIQGWGLIAFQRRLASRLPISPLPPTYARLVPQHRTVLRRDWSINLGTAGTAIAMYPAKFGFDVTATPNCTNDFVVFPISALGSAVQPNIVAFNNLYSGTTPANGICNRTPSGSDVGTAATVLWSYNVSAITGAVTTSPVISLDSKGSEIAFVESVVGSAHFHVLAWNSGDGQSAANLQNVLLPKQITTFVATEPTTAGTATDLSLGTTSDTLSSPFVDYGHNVAYVGDDSGALYRVKNVFCTPVAAACGSIAAPSLDGSWGTGGKVSVCSGALTGPVLDFVTTNVYVGCADGKLYSVSQTGTVKSVTVGDGVASKTFGAIVDPPVVDGVNGFVYAASGSASNGANGVLVQAKVDFSSSVAVPIGAGNQCNIHAPALNNAYYTSPTSSGALIYIAGAVGTVGPCTAIGATGGNLEYYAATFGAKGVLNSGAPANSANVGNPGNEFAPFAEFYNANIGSGEDILFLSALCTGADMVTFNITSGFPGTTFAENPVAEGFGSSGMIVDNNSTSAQASSIYTSALGENASCTGNTGTNTTPGTNGCAVKLTQAALQ
jgi:hypothetical protein